MKEPTEGGFAVSRAVWRKPTGAGVAVSGGEMKEPAEGGVAVDRAGMRRLTGAVNPLIVFQLQRPFLVSILQKKRKALQCKILSAYT